MIKKRRKNAKGINVNWEQVRKLMPNMEGKHWHISILTVLLVVFLLQLTYGIIINSAKIYSLNSKVYKLEKIKKVAVRKNQFLRDELEKYSSNSGVEALARNRLQFSKSDETLIIIKENQDMMSEDY